ncbi:hypothetical protein IJG72_03475 [bacterium]|nr:hypothetical protein [bacterium]
MNKKCTEFEKLYLFRTESELAEHVKDCPDCQAEMEKMNKVSELIQEVKPYYIKQRKIASTRLKVACILCFGMLTCLSVTYFTQLAGQNMQATYYTTDSVQYSQTTNEYGIPLDNYGLIAVN